MKLSVRPLTPERWADLETLFNAEGCSIARMCWCMHYRRSGAHVPPSGWSRSRHNKARLKALVNAGRPPGLIGYRGEVPVGWVSLGPRGEYARLARSVAYARRHGARLIEAYPVDRPGRTADENLWFGTKSMYDEAGFAEVARRKPQRPVVRLAASLRAQPRDE